MVNSVTCMKCRDDYNRQVMVDDARLIVGFRMPYDRQLVQSTFVSCQSTIANRMTVINQLYPHKFGLDWNLFCNSPIPFPPIAERSKSSNDFGHGQGHPVLNLGGGMFFSRHVLLRWRIKLKPYYLLQYMPNISQSHLIRSNSNQSNFLTHQPNEPSGNMALHYSGNAYKAIPLLINS